MLSDVCVFNKSVCVCECVCVSVCVEDEASGLSSLRTDSLFKVKTRSVFKGRNQRGVNVDS